MRNSSRVSNPIYSLLPVEVKDFDLLANLALDISWSWKHIADEIWNQLDPVLWDLTHNPWVVLQTASRERIEQCLSDPAFRAKVEELTREKRRAACSLKWFQKNHPQAPLSWVAYFSMEFMLSEALPIYSGGLGNVAGDQLKAASDLGVPVVGVGLLYQQGYFRQVIDRNGAQRALFPYNDPGQLPIVPLRDKKGEWLRLEVDFPGYSVWLRAWQVQVGNVKLYLLDSNDAANLPAHRGITSELYGGGPELRLAQEMVLGIGGWRLLTQLGIRPDVCHLNEGHAAFAVLERARTFMKESGQSFPVALTATRTGNLFTTHTAVEAGFDRYSPALIRQYLGGYVKNELGITLHDLLSLGRQNPDNSHEDFNMAYLAIRGSGAVNGVSRLHGQVSRHIFEPIFPRWPKEEVPVGYVTNGVHVPNWDSRYADELWTTACGKNRWLGETETLAKKIRRISVSDLWNMRTQARLALVEDIRRRLVRQVAASGASMESLAIIKHIFDANVLTLGFARRFTKYKRPNLLLHDPERLARLLTDPKYPVQLVIAGKAHPQDLVGQELIKEWTKFLRRPEICHRVIFLSDYDMRLAEQLVQGIDVWINTPQRPWEASGTSGMKILVNGGLNLSELDGWWAEAYTPQVGWALGDGKEHGEDPAWNAKEADALYDLLESEVIPEFYNRDEKGIPLAWVERIRESMAKLTPHFSANRVVREYTEQHYLPAAAAYQLRAQNKGEIAYEIEEWKRFVEENWSSVRFGEVKVATSDNNHVFTIQLYLNEFPSQSVRVELFAEGFNGYNPGRYEMELAFPLEGALGGYVYRATIPALRSAGDYTVRVMPYHSGVAIPLEVPKILWQDRH
ncbi:MAG: alpha-glucan phosphorylase [Firmicutes bacterium]|nr:alpha-glucan phosphorylase [Bacillota bacterium]